MMIDENSSLSLSLMFNILFQDNTDVKQDSRDSLNKPKIIINGSRHPFVSLGAIW